MPTRRRIIRVCGTLLGGVVTGASWRVALGDPLAGWAQHRTGFSVMVPPGFEVRRADGRLVMVETGDLRAPRRVEIDAIRGLVGRSCPAGWPLKLSAGGACHRVRQIGQGSAGTVWQLEASRPFGDLAVTLMAQVQTELQPDFAFAWDVLESVR
ncbi:MAG: Tsi3 family protein [Pseudomonadota bacterium]